MTKKHQIKEILKDEELKQVIQECLNNSNETFDINNLSDNEKEKLQNFLQNNKQKPFKKVFMNGFWKFLDISTALMALVLLTHASLLTTAGVYGLINNYPKGNFIIPLIEGIMLLSTLGLITAENIKTLIKNTKENSNIYEVVEKIKKEHNQRNNEKSLNA